MRTPTFPLPHPQNLNSILDVDRAVPKDVLDQIREVPGIRSVRLVDMSDRQ